MDKKTRKLAIIKGHEHYVFLYDPENYKKLSKCFEEYATDKNLSFTWYDAAILSQQARRQMANNNSQFNSDLL